MQFLNYKGCITKKNLDISMGFSICISLSDLVFNYVSQCLVMYPSGVLHRFRIIIVGMKVYTDINALCYFINTRIVLKC